MKYLLEIDGLYYGYDNVTLLFIDRSLARQDGHLIGNVLRKENDLLRAIYRPVSEAALQNDIEHERLMDEERRAECDYEDKKSRGLVPACPGDI